MEVLLLTDDDVDDDDELFVDDGADNGELNVFVVGFVLALLKPGGGTISLDKLFLISSLFK